MWKSKASAIPHRKESNEKEKGEVEEKEA